MNITKVKKRSGDIVDFSRSCIERTVANACRAIGVNIELETYSAIADEVARELDQKFDERIPCAEDVKGMVEMSLAERGMFEAAGAYAHYRKDHAQLSNGFDITSRPAPDAAIIDRTGQDTWSTKL